MTDVQGKTVGSQPDQLPLIDYTRDTASEEFFESLRSFGFATLIAHPLDMARVERIYQEWQTYFSSGLSHFFSL